MLNSNNDSYINKIYMESIVTICFKNKKYIILKELLD